jgi:uncharacterized protein YgiM (DUF1202 family)
MQLKALLCCGVVVALLLIAEVAPTWATASESPLRQTVPTKTPTDEPPPATTEPPPPATTKPPGPPPPGATDTPVSTLPPGVTATSTGLVATPPPVPTISGPAVFMTETVNVRVGPGTEFDVVGQYYRGYWAPATGKNAEPPTWWQVVYEAAPGQRGWVNAQYVVPNAEALKLPVVWGTPTAPAPAVTPATTTASQAPVATTAPAATVAPSKPAATGVPVATPANPSASVAMTASATPGPASTTGQGENISVTDLAPPVGVVLVLIGFGLWWSRRGKG